jgi:hypothetical protein
MKLATAILSLGVVASLGSNVNLAWEPPANEGIAGCNLYYGGASRGYTNAFNVGDSTAFRLTGLVPGQTYFFAVTCYDTSGIESDFSNELEYSVPELPATNIVTVSVPVLSATNLNGPWVNEAVFTISYTNPPGTKFFRFGLAITQTNQQTQN